MRTIGSWNIMGRCDFIGKATDHHGDTNITKGEIDLAYGLKDK